MRLSSSFGALLALGLLVAPAFAGPPPNVPPKAAPARTAKPPAKASARADKRSARMVEALKKRGLSEDKAKRVVAVLEKSRGELVEVKKQIRSARQDLKQDGKNAAAKQKLEAAKQKRHAVRVRTDAELARFLTPDEHAKVKQAIRRAGHHRKHARRHESTG